VNSVLPQVPRIHNLEHARLVNLKNMQDIAFLVNILGRLVDALGDDVEEAFCRIEIHLKRRTAGLPNHPVVDEPAPGQGQLQTTDLDRLFGSPEIS
jgi:hypothetical protein